MPTFYFRINLVGHGDTEQEAWEDACDAAGIDPENEYELVDNEKDIDPTSEAEA